MKDYSSDSLDSETPAGRQDEVQMSGKKEEQRTLCCVVTFRRENWRTGESAQPERGERRCTTVQINTEAKSKHGDQWALPQRCSVDKKKKRVDGRGMGRIAKERCFWGLSKRLSHKKAVGGQENRNKKGPTPVAYSL